MTWSPADLRTIGYFAKQPGHRPDWLAAPQVELVCSVTECDCSTESPPDWIGAILRNGNDLFLFDDLATLEQVIPQGDAASYLRYGLRTLPVAFEAGAERPVDLTCVHPEPIPPGFVRLGCDLCSRIGSTFDSSALSCCSMAARHPTNRLCLIDDFAAALRLAELFGHGQGAEPGPHWLLEVWADRLPGEA